MNYPDDVHPNRPDAPWNRPELPPFIKCWGGKCLECKEPAFLNDELLCEDCFDKKCNEEIE